MTTSSDRVWMLFLANVALTTAQLVNMPPDTDSADWFLDQLAQNLAHLRSQDHWQELLRLNIEFANTVQGMRSDR